tara:strand:- start:408 stop:1436 length:1029 start_codon:yes stop_codon:yes gene_type:complete
MTVGAIATSIAVGVATNVLTSKIAGKPEQPVSIGSGTSPSLSPGKEMTVSPVEGSQVQEFGNFQFENLGESEGNSNELLAQLTEAGINPEDLDKYGIAGMAIGGYLNRANGGNLGIMELYKQLTASGESPEIARGVINLSPEPTGTFDAQKAEMDLRNELLAEDMEQTEIEETNSAQLAKNETDQKLAEEAKSTRNKVAEWFEGQDPMLQDAITGGIASMGNALAMRLLGGGSKPRGSLVKTETLPGNSNRRRSALKMNPIGGSNVTFAKEGSALKRPMFMPNGGAMHGPGGPKDDLIPVMASNGEYMLSKAAVDAAGNGSHAKGIANLEKFNRAGNRRYGN